MVVTQVDSGHKIWVQETDNSHQMETLEQMLQKEYSFAWEDLDLEVLVPFPGLRCVTRYQTYSISKRIHWVKSTTVVSPPPHQIHTSGDRND